MSIVNEKVLSSNTSHLGKIGKSSELEYLKTNEIDKENIDVNNLDNLITCSSVSRNTQMDSNMSQKSGMEQNLSASTTSSGSEKWIPNTSRSMELDAEQNYYNEICMNENDLANNKYDNSISKDKYINKNNEHNSRVVESDKASVNPCTNENDALEKSKIIESNHNRLNELSLEYSQILNQIYGKKKNENKSKYNLNLNSELLNGEIVDSEILNKQMVASEILKKNIVRCKISQNKFIDDTINDIISQINDENSMYSDLQNIKHLKNNVENDIPIDAASSNKHALLNLHMNNTITNYNGDIETDGVINNVRRNGNAGKEIRGKNMNLNKIQDIKEKDDFINNLDNKGSQKNENRNKNNKEKLARQKNNSEMKKSNQIYKNCSKMKKNENTKELNLSNKNYTNYSSVDSSDCCSEYPKCNCYSINNFYQSWKASKKNRNRIIDSDVDAIYPNKTNKNDSINNNRDKDKRRKKEQLNKTQESIKGSQNNRKKEIDGNKFRCNTSISNQNYINNLKISNINDHNNCEENENESPRNINELTNEEKEIIKQYINKYGPISINNNYELLMRDKSLAKNAMNTIFEPITSNKKNTSRISNQGSTKEIMDSISQNRDHSQLESSNFDNQQCRTNRNTGMYSNFIYEQLSKPINIPNKTDGAKERSNTKKSVGFNTKKSGEFKDRSNTNKRVGVKERSNVNKRVVFKDINDNETMYNSKMDSRYCQNGSNGRNILPYDPKMNIKNKYYKGTNQRDMEYMRDENYDNFSRYRNEIYNNQYDDCNGITSIMNNNQFINNSKSLKMQDIMNMNSKMGNVINGDDNILQNSNLDRNKLWADVVGNKGIKNIIQNSSSNMKDMFEFSNGSNKMRDYDISLKSVQGNNNYVNAETNDDRQSDEINNYLMNGGNNLQQKGMHMSFTNQNQNQNMSNLCNGIDANYDAENFENGKSQNKNIKNTNRKGGKLKKSKSFGGTIKKGGNVFNLDLESYRIKKTPLCIYSVRDICNNYKLSKKHIKYTASYEVAVDCDCTIHHSIQCVKDYVGFLKEVHLKKKKKNEENKYKLKGKRNSKGQKQNKNVEKENESNKDAEKNDTKNSKVSKVSKPNIKVEENKMGSNQKVFIKKEKLSDSENEKKNEKENEKENAKINIKVNVKENIKKERVENAGNQIKKENNKPNEIQKRDEKDEENEENEENDDDDEEEEDDYEDDYDDDDDDDEDDDDEDEDDENNIYNLSQCNNILYNINKIWHPGFNRPLGDVGRKLILKEIREHHHRDPKKTTDLLLERGLDYGKVRFMRVNELYHYMYALDSFEYAIKISLEFGSNIRMSTISNRVDHSSLCLNLKSGYSFCLICCSQRPNIYGLYSNINLMQHMLLLKSSYKYLNKFARKTNLPKKDKLARAMRKTMEKNRNGNNKKIVLYNQYGVKNENSDIRNNEKDKNSECSSDFLDDNMESEISEYESYSS
ncbi:conserved Plasmodium protein, unknown function [Plasmodium yoelii]|uniref:Uncharacterized protein n=2 Tax=Plasmodium yoelii TaxID=5861 RepID=A0AAF0B837_PLAYO|nr:hypothetical protein Py17XNL_001401333 [Plasmodium yoelii yoelii]CDU20849.1 conserved Plasmodium protein, unknown function [Plasmodium yoelii]